MPRDVPEAVIEAETKSAGQRIADLLAANERLQRELAGSILSESTESIDPFLLRQMIDQVADILFIKDLDSRFVFANAATAQFHFDAAPDGLIGKNDFDLHSPALAQQFYAMEQAIMRSGKPVIDFEEAELGADGHTRIYSTTKVPLRNTNGMIIGVAGVARDITEQRAAQDRIRHLVDHDALTGLANRGLFTERLRQEIEGTTADTGLTVVFVDVDHFKHVNDSLGHNAGDDLLQRLAARFVAAVGSDGIAARLGGDEFVLLLTGEMACPKRAGAMIQRLRANLSEPMIGAEHTFRPSCSFGVATFPQNGSDVATLLGNADAAMYSAKRAGRDTVRFYSDDMNVEARNKLMLQNDMRDGLARDEFHLVYQPQIDLKSGRIFGVEALLRWRHPEHGIIAPANFIPLAEETTLIVAIGDWVLRTACMQNRAWQSAGLDPVTMAVNVSARQFGDQNWTQRIGDILAESRLEGRYLELELTESMVMHNVEQAIGTMLDLRAMGIALSIDDFGTGFSNLSALKRFPVSRLKIDRSLITNIVEDDSDRAIATTVISLGRNMKMRVIAEGVETMQQWKFLRDNHCDEMQGYYFSRPVDAGTIETMLRRQAEDAAG